MPSPFPGMNPYLEQERVWNDSHESFMPAARDALAGQVRPHFIAKIKRPVPIPLRPPHADAQLDLQTVLHRVYDGARYEDYIYRGQPHPQLNDEDAAWARQFVPGAQ